VQREKYVGDIRKNSSELENTGNAHDLPRPRRGHLNRIIETIPDGIMIRDRQGKITFANTAAEQILGLNRSTGPGKVYDDPTWQVLSVDGKPLAPEESTFARVKANNEPLCGEEHIIRQPDGRCVSISTNASPLHDENGEFAGVVSIISNIMPRKRMEEKIAQSERKYRELVENAPLGVYKDNIAGDYIYVNKAMADLLEYASPEELMSVGALSLYKNPKDRERFLKELRQSGKVDSAEYEFVTKGGTVKTVLVSKWLDGDIVSGVVKDMSELKQLQEQLIQTQKLEGLGNIAAGVAHDFNNILGVILGYSELLNRTCDAEKFKRAKLAITTSVDRGKSLVKQLLTFARKTETKFESVHVKSVLAEIESLMRETFPKTIEVSIKVEDDLPTILADITQIHQVLLNICVNARDAMPRGGRLFIRARRVSNQNILARHPEAHARDYIEIQIKDEGIGMDEEIRRRIFEPFFTTKGIGKGTGLGLSVVYGIIESHKAFIDVASQIGKGTTFTTYFPVEERHVESIELDKASLDNSSNRTGTVLIIEDEEWLRELAVDSLGSSGYEILTAQDGEEAIRIFKENRNRISAVISDLGLPKLSGEEVINSIRVLNPDAKIIVASGYIDLDVKTSLGNQGIKYFIRKPYMPNEMLRAINNSISGIE